MIRRLGAVALVALCMGFGPGQCSSSEILSRYGYTEIRPPSSLLKPGALVCITNHAPFEAFVICSAEASLGVHAQTMQSVTTNASVKQFNNRSFKVDAAALNFKENQNLQDVQSVTATIKNARIVELSDEAVLAGMRDRSEDCARAVAYRVRKGYVISMISSALYADFSYQVSFKHAAHNASKAPLKAMAINDLAVALEGDYESSQSGDIEAKGLIFGVKDSEYLSALVIPYVNEEQFPRTARRITGSIKNSGNNIESHDVDSTVTLQSLPSDNYDLSEN